MNIELLKVASFDLPFHPAYICQDLRQVHKVCELTGTNHAVWSKDEIDKIGRLAASGVGVHMCDYGTRISISLPPAGARKTHIHTILAALRCYQKHIGRDSAIDDIATNGGEVEAESTTEIDELCMDLNCGQLSIVSEAAAICRYEEVLADHRRLVRELDVAINGEEGAAKQASLCDIVAQVRNTGLLAPVPPPFTSEELIALFEVAVIALADADMFDAAAEAMCLEDEVMVELREKLQKYMAGDSQPNALLPLADRTTP